MSAISDWPDGAYVWALARIERDTLPQNEWRANAKRYRGLAVGMLQRYRMGRLRAEIRRTECEIVAIRILRRRLELEIKRVYGH